jgi:hypothetical protein
MFVVLKAVVFFLLLKTSHSSSYLNNKSENIHNTINYFTGPSYPHKTNIKI